MVFTPDIDNYIQQHSTPETPELHQIYRQSNLRMVNPRMVSGHVQGLFLSFISQMMQPEYILEIGTYTGYSALCLAKGLKPGGELHTIEVNDEVAEFAKENLNQSEFAKNIFLHIGSALEIIPSLNVHFDIIFIDGEKREYPEYFQLCKNILKPGGILLADNVLWDGKVVDPAAFSESATKAVMEFNDLIQNDTAFENVLLPIRDGIMMARKLY